MVIYIDWGQVYINAKDLGNTKKDKKGITGFFDEWYTTRFEYKDLEIIISEWCNNLAYYPWLDSMTIYYNGRKVYYANVHRDDASRHNVDVFSNKKKWLKQIHKFCQEYE